MAAFHAARIAVARRSSAERRAPRDRRGLIASRASAKLAGCAARELGNGANADLDFPRDDFQKQRARPRLGDGGGHCGVYGCFPLGAPIVLRSNGPDDRAGLTRADGPAPRRPAMNQPLIDVQFAVQRRFPPGSE